MFTEPFFPADRNSYLPENREDAEAIINDRQMVLEIGQLKYKFMTSAEALLHGDLHTGSVMVKSDLAGIAISTKAFDSEFSFYGPIGFDIGACFANLYIALARATALGRKEQADFVAELPEELWVSFEYHFRSLWPNRADKRVFSDQFLEEQMTQWKIDAVGFASAKMVRRIVGLAKTSDIETLEPQLRIGAARGILRSAQMAIRERHSNIDLTLLTKKIREILEETRTS